MSEKKDELIRVLTETVEVQKTVIRQLEDTAGYNEAKIRALEDEKERLKTECFFYKDFNKKMFSEQQKLQEGNLNTISLLLDQNTTYSFQILKYQNETFFQFLKRKLWS